jgi:hypothetical protein
MFNFVFRQTKMRIAALVDLCFSKRSLILLPVLLASSAGCAQSWTPDAAIISRLESSIKPGDIPLRYSPGHPPVIDQYARYYFGYMANNHKMIRSKFVLPFHSKMKPAGVYMVGSEREFPIVFDGGCGVMHVVYDVDASLVVSLRCNGDA